MGGQFCFTVGPTFLDGAPALVRAAIPFLRAAQAHQFENPSVAQRKFGFQVVDPGMRILGGNLADGNVGLGMVGCPRAELVFASREAGCCARGGQALAGGVGAASSGDAVDAWTRPRRPVAAGANTVRGAMGGATGEVGPMAAASGSTPGGAPRGTRTDRRRMRPCAGIWRSLPRNHQQHQRAIDRYGVEHRQRVAHLFAGEVLVCTVE